MTQDSKDSLNQLYEELEGIKLRIAFVEMENIELETLMSDSTEYSEAARKKALETVEQEIRRKEVGDFLHKTAPRIGQFVAVVLLVCFIGLSTAIATVHSVRVKVLEFIMNIEDEYTELGFDDSDDVYMDVPAEWMGNYYPVYIPNGFTLHSVDLDMPEVTYTDVNGNNLSFSEFTSDAYTNIDTEEAETRLIEFKNGSALVSEKNGHVFVAWAVDNRYFIVDLYGPQEMALEIAESVRMIK